MNPMVVLACYMLKVNPDINSEDKLGRCEAIIQTTLALQQRSLAAILEDLTGQRKRSCTSCFPSRTCNSSDTAITEIFKDISPLGT